MSRRRRSRGGGLPLVPITLLLAVVVLVATAGAPTAAFTSGSLARGSTAAVTDDTNGLLGLDVTGSVNAGSSSRLVTVTNQLDRPLDVDVASGSASVSLTNAQATLAPSESLTASVTVGCESPPDAVTFTVAATAGSQFTGTATRSTTVDTSDCARDSAFASIRLADTSTAGRGGKAEYVLQYVVDAQGSPFANVTVELENRDRGQTQKRVSTTQNGNIQFESGGQRFGERWVITIRLFETTGEVQTARIRVTDTADGSGTVYQAP